MGREATVRCTWGKDSAICKVLLESHELIVRGEIRRRIPFSELTKVSVHDDRLCFHAGKEEVSLELGSAIAQRWAKAIATPPPTLAAKLGITSGLSLLVIGTVEGDELLAAIADAKLTDDDEEADLIVAPVKSQRDMRYLLDRFEEVATNQSAIPPLWVVYEKGIDSAVGETAVRTILREQGFIDTKITSVSAKLTALRFIKRSR